MKCDNCNPMNKDPFLCVRCPYEEENNTYDITVECICVLVMFSILLIL